MQSHWDGPDYSIAVVQYSLKNFTPSPPGYPLYILIGKFFYPFTHDPHLSILMVSVLFAGLGTSAFYYVGKNIFNKAVGIIASLLFLTAPTIYYFGITANPYGILPTTAALLACVVYLIWAKEKKYGVVLGLVYSFAIGIRPQDALFLSPLALYGFIRLPRKEKYISFFSFIISFLAWFIPLANSIGGIQAYINFTFPFFINNAKPDISFLRIAGISLTLIKGFFLTLGLGGIFLIYYCKKALKIFKKGKFVGLFKNTSFVVFILWIFPSLLFNLFVRSDHAAHQMTYLSSLIFLSSYAIWKIARKNYVILCIIVIFLSLFNLVTFFRDRDPENNKPYVSQSYHYSEIVKNNVRMLSTVSYITKNYDPKKTIVIVDPEIFRPVTYYLKKYDVYAYSSLDTNDPKLEDTYHFGINWMYFPLIDKKHSLSTDGVAKTIICITNNKNYAFNFKNVKKIYLKDNAFIYSFIASPKETYVFSIHSIKLNNGS